MNKLESKQKIILGGLVLIIIGLISYYVYAKGKEENNKSINNLEIQNVETENETENETNEEEASDETILVHISGAVNKEGVIELKSNSRISDAIDKARRY